MLDYAPVPTPMIHSSRLKSSEGTLLSEKDSSTYRRLIGKLIYITNTRPDITFSVNNLSHILSSPTKAHQQAIFRVLLYLKGNSGSGIFLHRNSPIHLRAYSDSDWATCPDTRKSVTGHLPLPLVSYNGLLSFSKILEFHTLNQPLFFVTINLLSKSLPIQSFMSVPSTLKSTIILSEKRSLLGFSNYFQFHLLYKLPTYSQNFLLQLCLLNLNPSWE